MKVLLDECVNTRLASHISGFEVATASGDFSKNKGERFVTFATTGCAIWNVGLAFLVGLALAYLGKRGRLRL